MSESLPLFPLVTVLYPGLLLPLHIFEERYRQLVRDLMDGPDPRQFGVIAIRKGRETGVAGVSALFEIGCTATLRRVTEHDDGTFDLVTVGARRFRLESLDDPAPYLQGQVEFLADAYDAAGADGSDDDAADAVRAVQHAFGEYLGALAARGGARRGVPDLPDDPLVLSYLVAASMVIDLPDQQALLAEPDARHRLEAERRLLARETAMLRTLTSMPAPDLRYTPSNPN
jgi:hypothetical protein